MKPDPVVPFTFSVGSYKDFLSSRELGKTVLRDLHDRTPPKATTVLIDFTGVVAMTISFADEFLGQYYSLLATQNALPATVALTGLHDELRETIVVCLERRELIALELRHGQLAVLAASDVLVDTYVLAEKLKTFTALKVSEQLGITAPNANNRLKRLTSARALVRHQGSAERGGKEFTYSAPNPASLLARSGA